MSCQHALIVKKLCWQSEIDTAAFAHTLAQKSALVEAVVELQGDLGSGKTTFARYLLAALGVKGRIKSPTYAVVENYTGVKSASEGAAPFDIWHFDFYRFNDPEEWEEAGFRDIFSNKGLKLVEWAEKAGDHQPEPDLVIALQCPSVGFAELASDSGDGIRLVSLQACTPLGKELLE